MKINRLEAHDRYKHLIEDQSKKIWEGAEDCLKRNPDSLKMQENCHYIYIFAHPRSDDESRNKRLLWQPRLVKPKAQTNSYLFRATSNTDMIEICWLLPPRELWGQYTKGKVCESNWVSWSIDQFKHNRTEMEKPFPDDLTDEQALKIFISILKETVGEKNGII